MQAEQTRPKLSWQGFIAMALYLLMMPVALFLAAGTISWPMGWIYIGLLVGVTVVSRLAAFLKHPDLLVERSRFSELEDVARWDRPIVFYIAVVGPLTMMVVAGLNYRFGWEPSIPSWLVVVGSLSVIAGYALAAWAIASNRFFSGVVRIQRDRGQAVVAEGPYHWIRHPGYAGGVWSNIASPFMLATFWALIPALSICIVLAIRTKLEDRLLLAELDGYSNYALKTRYRLVPGIW